MRLRYSGLAAVFVLGVAAHASAQQPAADARPQAADAVDVTRLPIDLNRIQRNLRQSADREERNGLNLRYVIDVYGTAPRIEFFDPRRDNLLNGPVPYGGPTHQQMLEVMTPQEFRAPAMDFSALMRWMKQRSSK